MVRRTLTKKFCSAKVPEASRWRSTLSASFSLSLPLFGNLRWGFTFVAFPNLSVELSSYRVKYQLNLLCTVYRSGIIKLRKSASLGLFLSRPFPSPFALPHTLLLHMRVYPRRPVAQQRPYRSKEKEEKRKKSKRLQPVSHGPFHGTLYPNAVQMMKNAEKHKRRKDERTSPRRSLRPSASGYRLRLTHQSPSHSTPSAVAAAAAPPRVSAPCAGNRQ